MSKQNNLTEIWNVYNNSIIQEGKAGTRPIEGGMKKMGLKPGKGAVDLNSKAARDIQNTKGQGTTEPVYEIEGMEEPIDPKTSKKKDELYDSENFSSQKYDKKVGKKIKESINNNMKSTFDKLFESVMSEDDQNELEALGIDAGDEGDVEVGETDEVTITLDRDMAEKLCDLLKEACGDDDDMEAEDGEHHDAEDYEGEEGFTSFEEAEEDEDEDEDTVDEATEMHEVPSSAGHKLQSKQNKVGNVRASGGKATGNLKKVSNGAGQDLPDSAGHKLTSKKNVVAGKAGKAGDLFA